MKPIKTRAETDSSVFATNFAGPPPTTMWQVTPARCLKVEVWHSRARSGLGGSFFILRDAAYTSGASERLETEEDMFVLVLFLWVSSSATKAC